MHSDTVGINRRLVDFWSAPTVLGTRRFFFQLSVSLTTSLPSRARQSADAWTISALPIDVFRPPPWIPSPPPAMTTSFNVVPGGRNYCYLINRSNVCFWDSLEYRRRRWDATAVPAIFLDSPIHDSDSDIDVSWASSGRGMTSPIDYRHELVGVP